MKGSSGNTAGGRLNEHRGLGSSETPQPVSGAYLVKNKSEVRGSILCILPRDVEK